MVFDASRTLRMEPANCLTPPKHAQSFGPLKEALVELRVKNAVLDGEIVYLDQTGRGIFKDVLHRRGEPIFYAFDLL